MQIDCFAKILALLAFLLLINCCVVSAQNTDRKDLPPGDELPPTIFERVKNAGDSDKFESDHIVVYECDVNRVKESGVTEVESETVYKILTASGANGFSVLIWNYDPLSSFVRIDEVNIVRGDSIISVNVDMVKDLPAPQSGIYWNSRQKSLQLPRLKVNDGVQVKLFRKGFTYALLDEEVPPDENYIPPMPGEYFDIVLFESSVPIVEKRYVLTLPKSKRLHAEVYNGRLFSSVRYDADSTIYSWWNKGVPARKNERYQPGRSDYVAKVVMSTAESWEAKSRWFYEINEGQFEPTESIRKKVDEILREAKVHNGTEPEKAKALLHWAANNIRYSGQTMGKGEGFTLHSGEMVFRQRSGVCKDIASMLVVMMRAAGMDSYAAMTMAGSRIEDLPADQFNHSVTALRKADGSFEMYDPTWAPMSMNIWSRYEMEQHYVIGTPEGEDLCRIRYSPPEESPLWIDSEVEIDENGNLAGELELKAEGAVDSRLRRMIDGRISHVEDYLTGVLSIIDERVELIDYEHLDLYDFSEGMWIELKYRIPEFALNIGDGFELQSPMMQLIAHDRTLFRVGDYEWPEERQNDLFLYMTQMVEGEEEIEFPRKYSIAGLPKEKEIDETYAYFHGWFEDNNNELRIKQKISIKRRQIPPDGYPGFRDAVNGAMKFAENVYRAEKGGAK